MRRTHVASRGAATVIAMPPRRARLRRCPPAVAAAGARGTRRGAALFRAFMCRFYDIERVYRVRACSLPGLRLTAHRWTAPSRLSDTGPVVATAAACWAPRLEGRRGSAWQASTTSRERHRRSRSHALHAISRHRQELVPLTGPIPARDYLGVDGNTIKQTDVIPPPYPPRWRPASIFIQRNSRPCSQSRCAAWQHPSAALA